MSRAIVLSRYHVGCHVSKARTILETIERMIYENLHTLQFYLSSPRGYKCPVPSLDDIYDTRTLLKEVAPSARVYVHACLLYNLCSRNEEQLQKTLDGLQLELDIAAGFGGHGVVVHIGSHPNRQEGIRMIASSIVDVLTSYTSTTTNIAKRIGLSVHQLSRERRLLLECCAGEGNKIGKNLQDFKEILALIPRELHHNVGVCIDTAHLHSAGDWDLSLPNGVDNFFKAFDAEIGLQYFKLLHLNDSKVPFGARRDLHEAIGSGTIFQEMDTFVDVLRTCHNNKIPMIMELPVPSEVYIGLARDILEKF